MMKSLPPDVDNLATKHDLAVLGADLRTEMRDLTAGQTRTLMLGLVGSVTALTATQSVVAAIG